MASDMFCKASQAGNTPLMQMTWWAFFHLITLIWTPTIHFHCITLIRLHGMPRSIVSGRGQIFVSNFWGAFFKLQGTKLCRSSAYHPQSDGQTEVVNLSLEHYLHCFIVDKPDSWSSLLHWAEWWHNTSFIRMTPFRALYGIPPHSV